MAYTQADLDAIDRAITGGTKRVTIEGKTVEYRDMDELLKARALIRAQLGQTSTSRRRYGTYAKGT